MAQRTSAGWSVGNGTGGGSSERMGVGNYAEGEGMERMSIARLL